MSFYNRIVKFLTYFFKSVYNRKTWDTHLTAITFNKRTYMLKPLRAIRWEIIEPLRFFVKSSIRMRRSAFTLGLCKSVFNMMMPNANTNTVSGLWSLVITSGLQMQYRRPKASISLSIFCASPYDSQVKFVLLHHTGTASKNTILS